LLLVSAPERRVPLHFHSPLASPLLAITYCNGAHPANPGAGPAAVASLDGDGLRVERARELRQLAANVDGQPPAWIVPPAADREPNPPFGYVVSFVWRHERGFTAPASCFMRGLCHHYGVELHNFAPNAISQAATFVGVCEGFLGIPVN
jgi:hypothetical protein